MVRETGCTRLKRGAVLRGPLDDLDVAPGLGVRQLGQQGLEPAEDDREEVVQVVGHARGELADGGERLPAHQLGLGRPQVVHHVLQLRRRLLRLLEQARIVHRVPDVRHERGQELEVGRAEGPRRRR